MKVEKAIVVIKLFVNCKLNKVLIVGICHDRLTAYLLVWAVLLR